MITLGWYLLKVIICSGILCGYYFLALRNKVFHRWNRFYILAAIVISLIVPVMKINVFQNNEEEGTVVQMLQTISDGDEAVVEYSRNSGFQINTENLAESAYLLVSAIFLTIFFVSLFKIKKLKRKYYETKIEGISFINTNEKGTPFSFFKSIFWNNAIDLHSKPGQQIFNHEIAHIKEKHSYDKIFMNMVLIFFWINPFFWLMRKELYMIHEFVADKEALEDSDINALAEMILQTVYPGQNFSVGNSFFYSPIKRRIMMLTKNKNPRVNYYSRLLVLPLAVIIIFAFTLKVNSSNSINSYNGKTIMVVIDAGQGGKDNGAHSANGLKEKDITLSIAKKIAALNSNDHIQILLCRDYDQSISVRDRVHFAKNHDADLFVSIHVNAAVNEQLNGFSVSIDRNSTGRNQLLASAIINELKATYKTDNEIEVRNRGLGLFIVDSNSCPAALIQCGYLSNSNDAAFISNDANQEKVAKNILSAINKYASSLNSDMTVANETLQSGKNDTIRSMYYKGKTVKNIEIQSSSKKIKETAPDIKVTYEDGSTEMISKMEADKHGIVLPPPPPPGLPASYFKSKALFVINGKTSTSQRAEELNPKSIESISILKGDKTAKKYGDKGKNGVIEINTKNKAGNVTFIPTDAKTINGFPSDVLVFINGKESTKEAFKNINPNTIESITVLKGAEAVKKYGNKGRDGSIEIVLKNNSLTTQAVDTLPNKVFTKVQVEASFPGGPEAWQKYIIRKIKASIDTFTNADYGTCVVRFIVNTDGSVSDVQATTMKGTLLAKNSVDAIKSGPKWIPASQNGHVVAAYRLQPITLTSPKTTSVNSGSDKKLTLINTKNDPQKVFIKLNEKANFPGGNQHG
jgi:N-acetylmuramoyl-L-alanine amidase